MPQASIGSLYDKNNVNVGQAAGFYANADTPLPTDSITVFDLAAWQPWGLTVGAASAGTFTVSLAGQVTAGPTAAIAFNALASAVQTAVQAILPAGYTATVTGTAPNWTLTIQGPGASDIVVSMLGTGLTGGGAAVTPPAWTPAGATEQGWQENYNVTTQQIRIEEQQTPVQEQVTDASLQLVANLSEDSIRSLKLALSAAATVQAPDTTHFGKTTLTLQTVLPVVAVALEAANRYGMPRRIYIPEAVCATNVGTTFRRAAAQRLVPVTFTSICDVSAIQIVEITANHS